MIARWNAILESRLSLRRSRRALPSATLAEGAHQRGLGPLSLGVSAVWFGLLAGLVELGVRLLDRAMVDRVTLATLRRNRHVLWMIPPADGALFAALGLLFALGARRRSPRVTCAALTAFAFLAGLAPLLAVHGLHPIACVVFAAGLAWRFVSILGSRFAPFERIVRFSLPVLVGLVGVWTAYEYDRVSSFELRALVSQPTAAPGAPNVLLIVLDTLRADRLSLYGYDRATSPRLDRLAERGVWFDHARAPAPWTLPSHASFFTGRWPHELKVAVDRPLNDPYPTLAEFLRDHGYAAAGFVANTFNANSAYRLDRGFAHYEDYYENSKVSILEALNSTELGRGLFELTGLAHGLRLSPHSYRKNAAMINRDALAWLSNRPARPFFLFLNFFDAHDPYVLPEGAAPRFSPASRPPADDRMLREWFRVNRSALSPREQAVVRDAYDDGIAYLDDQLGRLFDELARRGLLENTLVVITSDHGEQLAEHHFFGHGKSLYRQELEVPLLIFGPRRVPAGQKLSGPVSLRDLPATIVDLLGIAAPSPFPGRSLARFWEPGKDGDKSGNPVEPVLSEVKLRSQLSKNKIRPPALRGPMKALADREYTYIRNADGQEELYDAANDRAELHDLAASEAAGPILSRFREILAELQKSGPAEHQADDDRDSPSELEP